METPENKDTSDAGMDFYEIAHAIGKDRTKFPAFIGTDSIPDRELGESFNQAMYIFAVDFEGGKVRKVRYEGKYIYFTYFYSP